MTALTDFQTALSAASTAVLADDYDTARKQVLVARLALAQIPNSASDGTSAQWREDLAAVEKSLVEEPGRRVRAVTLTHEFQGG